MKTARSLVKEGSNVVNADMLACCLPLIIIFPSTYEGKIQWSISGIENVADFCHFVMC